MCAALVGRAVKFAQYDLLTDRNNLRKLYEFCSGERKSAFRIEVERIGNTVVLIRSEEKDRIELQPKPVIYGRSFERVCARPAKREDLSSRVVVRFLHLLLPSFSNLFGYLAFYSLDAYSVFGATLGLIAELHISINSSLIIEGGGMKFPLFTQIQNIFHPK